MCSLLKHWQADNTWCIRFVFLRYVYVLSYRILAISIQSSKQQWNPSTSKKRKEKKTEHGVYDKGFEVCIAYIGRLLHSLCRTWKQCNKNIPRLILHTLKKVCIYFEMYIVLKTFFFNLSSFINPLSCKSFLTWTYCNVLSGGHLK